MNLTLARTSFSTADATHGMLLHGMIFICYTLELPWRDNVKGESCIPCGDYKVEWEYSPKFKTSLYELRDVPNRTEIKFHAGNWVNQTDGCILPGLTQAGEAVERSQEALEKMYSITDKPRPFTLSVREAALFIPGEQSYANT